MVAHAGIRPTWGIGQALGVVVALSVPVVGLFVAAQYLPEILAPWSPVAVMAAVSLLLANVVWAWRRVVTTEYVLTDETVYTRRGRLRLAVEAAPMDKVTDVTADKGVIGRLLGYSSLTVRTAGGALHLPGVPDAFALRTTIQDGRKKFILRLLEEAGRSDERASKVSAAVTPSHGCRCPACAHGFEVVGRLPQDVLCPRCGAEGTLFATAVVE